jgi:hypothetical protein
MADEKKPQQAVLAWGFFAGEPFRQILAERIRIVILHGCRMAVGYAVEISFVNPFE